MKRRSGFPFAFACRRSGNCCAIPGGVVRLDAGDVPRIADHLGLTADAFAGRYLQADGCTLKDGLGNRCVFLADGKEPACAIYPVRPQRCRDWPFWPELGSDAGPELRQRLLQAARLCPGLQLDEPFADRPSPGQPGAGQPETGQPGTDQPDTDQPGQHPLGARG